MEAECALSGSEEVEKVRLVRSASCDIEKRGNRSNQSERGMHFRIEGKMGKKARQALIS